METEKYTPQSDKTADSTTICINGELKPGDLVLSTNDYGYNYLVGEVLSIHALGTPEHDAETENETDDAHVDFMVCAYSETRLDEIGEMLGNLYGKPTTPGIWPPYDVDDVIMPPDSLIRITGIAPDKLAGILGSEKGAIAFCRSAMGFMPEEAAHDSAEKPSVLARLREAAKAPKEPHKDKPTRKKSGPER